MKFYRENIKRLRESLGMTQENLASKLGIKKESVTQWESGETKPKSIRIPDLAKALHCQVQDICDLIPPEEKDSFRVLDSRISALIDLWPELSVEQQAELIGMAKAFQIENKKTCSKKTI